MSPGGLGLHSKKKFSVPPGGEVLDLNQRPPGCHSSRPCAFARLAHSRAGSEGPGSRPVLLLGLRGAGESQGLASSLLFIIPPLQAINNQLRVQRCSHRGRF